MPPSVNDRKRKQYGQFIRNECKKQAQTSFFVYPKMQTFNSLGRGWGKMKTNRKVTAYKLKTDRITKKKRVVTPTFYVIKWKWQTYSACHQFLVVSKSYLDCILAVPKEGCHRRFRLCRNDFVVQNVSKVFMLPFAMQF